MNGILLVDKPQDFTSHDVVAKLRGILKERRIGHAGTLDPMATGLLVVFVGRATRAVQFAESHGKTYLASMRGGLVTDTQDITGTVLSKNAAEISDEELAAILPRFTGELLQTPPMYSAVKKGGKKLYELARKGIEVEREARKITIYSLELLGRIDGGDFLLRVECSKGTYIRTLCHDMGQALGTGAVLTALRRERSGDFSVENAHSLEEISEAVRQGREEELLLPVDSLFFQYPALSLDEGRERLCRCGNSFKTQAGNGYYRVYSQNGEFLMLGQVQNGVMTTVKSFFNV